MPLTKQQLKANDDYYTKIAKITKMYIWKDEGLIYMIENKKYVCDTGEKTKNLFLNTSNKWFKKNAVIRLQK